MKKTLSEIHTPNVKNAPGMHYGVGKKNPTGMFPGMKKKTTQKAPRKMA